ncbi:MAG: hypothetical protein ACLSGA_12105 [Ruminococcus sp.]
MKIRWHNENKLHMQVKENNGVTYHTHPLLNSSGYCALFQYRLGGVSREFFHL